MDLQEPSPDQIKAERKKASQVGLLLGGVALAAGALLCLIYLLIYKPWRLQ
ncbi:MAG: hypothetical protein HYY63_03730 [Elusimicrobia bacterium]|nr:hypothetical protein [Elusimicrobiota bacterium]MBI3012715.1 hypothetical protein [Elusimicrobiota bacterium]